MSEVGFRDMSKNNEVKVESTKPATDLKMTPATTLVPDKNYLRKRQCTVLQLYIKFQDTSIIVCHFVFFLQDIALSVLL
jgi:hypothetical protein